VFWWWGRWLSEVGVGGFGFRKERDGGGVSGCLYGCWKMGEGGGKCDLKAIHAGLKPSTFERTKVRLTVLVQVHGCVGELCVRTYVSKFERIRAVKCACEGCCSQTRLGEVERNACTRSNVNDTFEHIEQNKNHFFFL
jgi:hypothetical protein